MKIHPRQYAIENNQSTYNGKPCKKCGGTLRYTSMTGCVACTRENSFIRNKTGIQKEYIEKNRKKINSYNRKAYNSLSDDQKKEKFLKSIVHLTKKQKQEALLLYEVNRLLEKKVVLELSKLWKTYLGVKNPLVVLKFTQ